MSSREEDAESGADGNGISSPEEELGEGTARGPDLLADDPSSSADEMAADAPAMREDHLRTEESGGLAAETRNHMNLEASDVTEATLDLHLRIHSLETQLTQRDEVITKLTSRLRQLEQGVAVEHVADQEDLEAVRNEIRALQNTKTFRYSAGIRHLYMSARRLSSRMFGESDRL